ncbi:hypothetical protein HY631_03645 [Candidatus Uhrbacteria bacterium]|nr:hypothetical protein [Candidatus Uhrbacteria bacterium]
MLKPLRLIALAVIALALIVLFVFLRSAPEETPQAETEEVVNPLEGDIPDTSPTQNTNPFSDTYKNPFE